MPPVLVIRSDTTRFLMKKPLGLALDCAAASGFAPPEGFANHADGWRPSARRDLVSSRDFPYRDSTSALRRLRGHSLHVTSSTSTAKSRRGEPREMNRVERRRSVGPDRRRCEVDRRMSMRAPFGDLRISLVVATVRSRGWKTSAITDEPRLWKRRFSAKKIAVSRAARLSRCECDAHERSRASTA